MTQKGRSNLELAEQKKTAPCLWPTALFSAPSSMLPSEGLGPHVCRHLHSSCKQLSLDGPREETHTDSGKRLREESLEPGYKARSRMGAPHERGSTEREPSVALESSIFKHFCA